MDKEGLQAELDILFNPELDEDGFFPPEYPPERITESHKLDISYMDRLDYEGSSIHPYTRIYRPDEHRPISLSRNHDVSQRLFMSAIQLFGDSIIAYHDKKERKGTVTLMTRILRGNTVKVFQEKAKRFPGTRTKTEQPPKIRLNFSISEIAQKMRNRNEKNPKIHPSLHKNFHPGEEPKQYFPGTPKKINFRFLLSKSPYFL